jgi:hypothetical protein
MTMGLSPHLEYAWIADDEPVLSTKPEPESGEIPLADLINACVATGGPQDGAKHPAETAWENDYKRVQIIPPQCAQNAPESVEASFAEQIKGMGFTVYPEATASQRQVDLSGEPNPADPHGIPQHTPGAKNDAGKIRASLLLSFPRALWAIATVADYGSRKYTRDGWEHVPEGEERYADAQWRHLLMGQMEENDQESGLPHAWHAAWGVLATLELQLRKQEAEQ